MKKRVSKNENVQGDVISIESSPNFAKDGLSLAATNQGLWRSNDGGRSWHNAFAALEVSGTDVSVTAIAFSPTFSQDQTILVGLLGGILISRDLGLTWKTVFKRNLPPLITDFSFHSEGMYPKTVVAGTLGDGVFLTYDRDLSQGSEWHPGNFGLLDHGVLCLASSQVSDFMYVGTESGVFQSHNGGRTWTETGFSPNLGPVLTLKVAGSPTCEVIWVGTEKNGIWWSDDDGHSWSESKFRDIQGPINALHPLNGDNQTILALIEQSLIYSNDQGASWSRIYFSELPLEEITAISICPRMPDTNTWIILLGSQEKGIERFVLIKQNQQLIIKRGT